MGEMPPYEIDGFHGGGVGQMEIYENAVRLSPMPIGLENNLEGLIGAIRHMNAISLSGEDSVQVFAHFFAVLDDKNSRLSPACIVQVFESCEKLSGGRGSAAPNARCLWPVK